MDVNYSKSFKTLVTFVDDLADLFEQGGGWLQRHGWSMTNEEFEAFWNTENSEPEREDPMDRCMYEKYG